MSRLRGVLRRVGTATAALTLLGSAGTWLATAPLAGAAAATRYVATTGTDAENDCTDPGHPCQTIQYAVGVAAAGDTVQVAAGTYPESVHIRSSVTLAGAGTSGADDTVVSGAADGGDPSIYVDGTDAQTQPEVTVNGLDVSGNSSTDGIRVESATVHVVDSVVSDNSGRGLAVDGPSTATVDGSTLDGNHIDGVELDALEEDSGAAPNATVSGSTVSGNGGGGIVVEEGNVTIQDTTLDSNIGAGVVVDDKTASATIDTSTVSGTKPFADQEGEPYGGGILVFLGTAIVNTSTIFGNTGQGVFSEVGTVTVRDSTIAGTVAGTSDDVPNGGVVSETEVPEVRSAIRVRDARPQDQESGPGVWLTGTIVASQADGVPDCATAVTSGGYNLSSDDTCGFAGTGDQQNADPRLGKLADNGGPTRTLMLGDGSPARDAIPVGKGTCTNDFATDQRGDPRPIGSGCDVGAVEAPAAAPPACPPLVVLTTSLPDGAVGQPYSQQLRASGGCDDVYHWSLAEGQLPPGLELSDSGVLSGTPTRAGDFTFTVSVNDPAYKQLSVHIAAAAATSTAPASSTPPSSSHSVGGASASAGTSSGTPPVLAQTGASVDSQARWAVALLVLGVGLLLAAGRRVRRRH